MIRRRSLIALLFAVVTMTVSAAESATPTSAAWQDVALANRWYRNLYAVGNQYWACSSAGMAAATNLAAQAADHGFTGVVVPIHSFFMTQWTAAHTNNFRSFVSFCSSRQLEVIPDGFAFNSQGMVFDRNFAEADPIDNMPLVATNSALWPAPNPLNLATNGSFEAHSGDTFPGYQFIDKPGVVSFADTDQSCDGSVSVRRTIGIMMG